MKRLLLISPVSQTSLMGIDFNFRFPVLGLLKVAALTPARWQVTIFDEKVEPLAERFRIYAVDAIYDDGLSVMYAEGVRVRT